MAWNDIEDAIRAWVKAGSGLADSQVYWSNQDGPDAQSYPFVTIRLGDMRVIGAADGVRIIDHTGDMIPPDPGEELEQLVTGLREFPVSVQVFAGDKVGASTARALASRIQTSLALPSIRQALDSAGLSPFDPGTVLALDAILDAEFEARAVLETRFYVMETLSERETYISDVEVEDLSVPQTYTIHIED